jgi:hypothetical protein
LFIPFTLTQGDLVQETLAVTLNEVWVSAFLSLLFIEWRLCIDGVDWLFLFASCFLIGSFSGKPVWNLSSNVHQRPDPRWSLCSSVQSTPRR